MQNKDQKDLQVLTENAETVKELGRELMQKINGEQAAKIGAFGVAGGILWLMLKELLKSL